MGDVNSAPVDGLNSDDSFPRIRGSPEQVPKRRLVGGGPTSIQISTRDVGHAKSSG